MTRLRKRDQRVYVDQYEDFNNDWFNGGPLVVEFDAPMGAAFADVIKNAKGGLGQPTVSAGTLNGYLHVDDAAGDQLFDRLTGAAEGDKLIYSHAFGELAAPAQGDLAFSGVFEFRGFRTEDLPGSGIVVAQLPLETWSGRAEFNSIAAAWGNLLHAKGAETGANAAGGVDNGAASDNGAYGFLHLLATDGTATFSIEHSTDDSTWSTLMTFDAGGDSAIAEIQRATGTVNQYTRWQVSLGTATSVTFVMTLVRG